MTDHLVAVVLAAGAGRRLRPLTRLLPKSLCPVGGVPLLDQALARAFSVTTAVAVNAHHQRTRLAAHVEERWPGVHLSVEEPEALGTAGALGHLRDWIDGRPVLVLNADAWHRADVGALVGGWDGARARLLTVSDPARGTWGDRRYIGAAVLPWEHVRPLPDAPAGLWEVSWRHLTPGADLDLVPHDGPFFDCGTPADYLAANLTSSGGHTVVGHGAVVEGEARESVVWSGARVERAERLWRAVRATDGVTVLVR
ncbi:MAG TPA: sugar phosphate nucleotidyltransferase [Acidimicrobiales bacterium]|nr:sugar phosphate nucleotidyltransferase [Acidimicrobiales bacterium]